MFKRLLTIFILALLATSITFAQESAKKIDPAKEFASSTSKHADGPQAITAGTQLFNTDYDYAGNNSIPNMIQMYDFDASGSLDVFAVGMKRIDGGTRGVNFVVGADGTFLDFLASDPALYTGWGTMQIPTAGPEVGKALIMGHQGGDTYWMNVNLASFTRIGVEMVTAGNFPSFVYLDDGTVFLTNTNGQLFKTTDMGTTLEDLGSLNPVDPTITDYNSEYLLKRSPNGQYIVHPTVFKRGDNGNGGFGGAHEDSTDYVALNYSTDAGATWVFNEVIGKDGISTVANRTNYFPIFENFGQINGAVDDNGVMHVTINGYGFWDNGTDTTFAYPALYWNSRDREWLALSNKASEESYDPLSGDRPGNGMGMAYPTVSMSDDGMSIVCVWQGPEYSGELGTSEVNKWTATQDNPNELHYCDLYYSVSADGGKTWSDAAKVDGASEQMVMESFPALNQKLVIDGDQATVHYLYMVDAIPGVSLFADNNSGSNDNYWIYDNFTVTLVTNVNDDALTVNKFELAQNYPNPFNPSTTINFSLPETGMVTLKVYDVLGKEVATLVNEVVSNGQHSVKFNADNLSTGIYFYELSAGEFVQTNKMMLIK